MQHDRLFVLLFRLLKSQTKLGDALLSNVQFRLLQQLPSAASKLERLLSLVLEWQLECCMQAARQGSWHSAISSLSHVHSLEPLLQSQAAEALTGLLQVILRVFCNTI